MPAGALSGALRADGADGAVLDAIAQLVHAERRATLERLERSFVDTHHDPDARRTFVEAFLALMREGEFSALDADTYRRATDQRFLLDIPVRVKWSALDEGWLDGLTEAQDGLPFAGRALFFFRDFDALEVRGFYPAAKVDTWLAGLAGLIASPFRRRNDDAVPRADRWMRRTSLGDTPWYAGLLTRATLEEPCFRQVVLVYRRAEDDAALTVKLFRDIPLADAEMVFPERRLGIRTLDAVLIGGSAIAAAPAIVRALDGGGGTAIAIATVLGGYVGKLVGQYLAKRRAHRARVTAALYDKSQDTDVGVLQYLVDAAASQTTREVALVHHFARGSAPVPTAELDARIEAWLTAQFDAHPNFDVAGACARAVELGVISGDDEAGWTAVEARAARAALRARWAQMAPPAP